MQVYRLRKASNTAATRITRKRSADPENIYQNVIRILLYIFTSFFASKY